MIKNKDNIKKEIKENMNKVIDEYVDSLDNGFSKDSFHIDEIEKLWGIALNKCEETVEKGTQLLVDNLSEKEIISKKKDK